MKNRFKILIKSCTFYLMLFVPSTFFLLAILLKIIVLARIGPDLQRSECHICEALLSGTLYQKEGGGGPQLTIIIYMITLNYIYTVFSLCEKNILQK